MHAWLSLTKKELRLGMPAFLMPVIAFLIGIGIASYIGYRTGYTWEVILGVSVFATGLQMFYIIYYLLYSLQFERKKLHLWLHNPLPGYALLLAKITAACTSMLVTLLLTATTVLLALNMSPHISEVLEWSNVFGILGIVHLFLMALYFAVWFLFSWMIFLWFTRHIGTVLSFISTFGIFIATITLYSWFTHSWVYQTLTEWGAFLLPEHLISIHFDGNIETNGMELMIGPDHVSIYFGTYVFEAAVALLLFSAACWMLNRKVEV